MSEALFIHGGALGDFVLSLRVVASLQRSGFQRVSVLGRREHADLSRYAGVGDYFDLNAGGHHALFAEEFTPSAEMQGRFARFDVAVDMLGGPDGPFHRNLSSLGIRRVLSMDPRPRPQWPAHISDQWLDDLRVAGLTADVGPPRIVFEESVIEAHRRRLRLQSGKNAIALIHPGSGSRDKCCPAERFIQLIGELRSRRWGIVTVLGPVERERFDPRMLNRFCCEAPVIENPSLVDLGGLMASADLFVGNDSGVSHLAAALGTPTVAIFGPTDPRRWRPLGDGVRVVSAGPGEWPDPLDILDAVETMAPKSRGPVA